MGGDFCRNQFPATMNRTAATTSGETFRKQFPAAMNHTGAALSRKLPQTVSCRHEPHCCRAEWETFRKQFPAAVNRTGAAPDRKLSAIVSCRHEPQSYHTEPGNPFTPKELSYDYHFSYLLPFLCL